MISGANRSTHDLIIDVGILSTGEDFAGIVMISLVTSSTYGGCIRLNNSPVCLGSAYSASAELVSNCKLIFAFSELILSRKKIRKPITESLTFTG